MPSSDAPPPLLEAHEVTVRFGGLVAVDAVSAQFRPGELVGIIGPNGAGKTTFFNAISGVQSLTSGRLVVEGRTLTGRRAHRFARLGVARTFQTPRTFAEMSVRDNIDFGRKFAGRRPRKYLFWGEEESVPWALRTADSILKLIGLEALAELPAPPSRPASSGCWRSAWRWRHARGCCCWTRWRPA
ncbi:MAG TPA: ATP-binding cassette domain-containing protein [Rubrivivax sp.]|nr:ATP-binding cassette domain-containing protein [Rubrivivax sp.]